jgi:putative PIN family toxin of toxin-antitoxin system
MRVLLDANIYFSYLLSPENTNSTIVNIVEAALARRFSVVIPLETVREMEGVLRDAPYWRVRASPDQLHSLVDVVGSLIAERPSLEQPWIDIVRDPNDDYLISVAMHADVDVLVSGDKDLLVLADRLARPKIMSPREFLALIEG